MRNLLKLSLLVLHLFTQISSKKFGYLLFDEGNVLNEKFVAFGSLPEDTDENDLLIISDNLNRFYRYHRIDKQRYQDPNAIKFSVNLFQQATLPDGSYQVALKGELSNFLALFRLTMMNAIGSSDVWKTVKFYSDPIIIMKKEAFKRAPTEIRVTLIRAAFDNFDVVPNNDLQVFDHKRTMSQAATKLNGDVDLSDLLEFKEDDSRYTVLEFHSSTGSLQNPLFDTPPKKTFIKPKTFKRSNCCNSCIIL